MSPLDCVSIVLILIYRYLSSKDGDKVCYTKVDTVRVEKYPLKLNTRQKIRHLLKVWQFNIHYFKEFLANDYRQTKKDCMGMFRRKKVRMGINGKKFYGAN